MWDLLITLIHKNFIYIERSPDISFAKLNSKIKLIQATDRNFIFTVKSRVRNCGFPVKWVNSWHRIHPSELRYYYDVLKGFGVVIHHIKAASRSYVLLLPNNDITGFLGRLIY